MPLLDHFHPPLSVSHPWKGFHSSWANAITNQLNEVMPEGYYAIPEVPLGDQTLGVEVHVFHQNGGRQLHAAVELVCPAHKERPFHCLAFARRCVDYLRSDVGVVVVDTVVGHPTNPHAIIAESLGTNPFNWTPPDQLYAVAYRHVNQQGQSRLEAWPRRLTIGGELPTLPLRIVGDLCLPLSLEATYEAACRALRISGR